MVEARLLGTSASDAAQDAPASISIATGIIVALAASFVQSLGLTIQRKSHLQNEALPASARKSDWKRSLWLVGFVIFITSNILGSVFQIGALPIVILAPLGAVSLLWNALFARFLLGDVFSRYLIVGTILVAGGAVLIAIFGVVPETTHTLEDLLELYSRPAFIIWTSLQAAILLLILGSAHWSEATLEKRLQSLYIALPTTDDEDEDANSQPSTPPTQQGNRNGQQAILRNTSRRNRRWSTPPAYLALNVEPLDGAENASHPQNSVNHSELPQIETSRKANGLLHSRKVTFGGNSYQTAASLLTDTSFTPETGFRSGIAKEQHGSFYKRGLRNGDESSIRPMLPQDKADSIRLWLGIAYGSASGTLSGLCLLFAKTGVELLILTVVGHNQFTKWQSWMIVLALLLCALLQLWYLNKSLRLVGPTLICPLAFCFYNLSSIFNGLMYYNQWNQLSPLQIGLMVLGIVVLLAGVWVVSIRSPEEEVEEELGMLSPPELTDLEGGQSIRGNEHEEMDQRLLSDEPEEESYNDLKSRIAHLYQTFLSDQGGPPRGFSVGIAASSPGFAIRPSHHRRNTYATAPSGSSHLRHSLQASLRHGRHLSDDTSALADSPIEAHFPTSTASALKSSALERTSSEPLETATNAAATAATREDNHNSAQLSIRHRRKRSLAGDVYVGSSNPFYEEPVYDTPPSPSSQHHPLRRSWSASAHLSETSPVSPEETLSPRKVARRLVSRLSSWSGPDPAASRPTD